MTKEERYRDVPHYDLIRENETIHIPSIFMFKSGAPELFSFLAACEAYNCTVTFDNESLIVPSDASVETNLVLTIYAHIAECPKIANDYMRYLSKIETMKWA